MILGSVSTAQYAVLSAAANNSTTLINAVNGAVIVVTGMTYAANAAGSVTFKTNATAISGAIPIAANTSLTAFHPDGLFRTVLGEPLVATTSVNTTATGMLTYVLASRV
jgi:hypothetical protein